MYPPKYAGSDTNEIIKHNTNKQHYHQPPIKETPHKVTYHSEEDDQYGSAEDSDDSDTNLGNIGDGDDIYSNNFLKPTRSGLDYNKNNNQIVPKTATRKPVVIPGVRNEISSGSQHQINILLLSLIVSLRYSHLIT